MDPSIILAGLSRVATEGLPFAIAWHLVIGAALIAVATGWRPARRTAAALLAAPLASVSAFAWAFGNPVNGTVFAALSAALLVLALTQGGREPVTAGARWSVVVGAGLVAFGWGYPHFLDRAAPLYLIAAPLGLIPCPTLAAVCGLALVGVGAPRAWSWTLAGVATFYALFGMLRLGVWLDVALLVGAVATAVTAARPRTAAVRTRAPGRALLR